MKFEGLYTAMVTPFLSNGELDEKGFLENLREQKKQGVEGVVILGTTGESPTLTSKEKEKIIEITVEEVKGDMEILVGTGHYSTKTTVEDSVKAEKLGADGIMVVVPYYNKPTQEGLYRHFSTIAEFTSIPLCIYNTPGRSGTHLLISTLKRLQEIPSIQAIKDCSGSLHQINQMLTETPRIKILSGDDDQAFPLIAQGIHGLISVASNLLPFAMHQLIHLALKGEIQQARCLHLELLPFFEVLALETNPIPIKAAMNYLKKAAGSYRLPLCPLSAENQKRLENRLNTIPDSLVKELIS